MTRRIGRWTYHPESNELRDGAAVRQIEERAARALDVLLERPGAVVGREQLIARVWGGRSVSDNSVPMVIGQLRKALGEVRGRSVIETIPKRGYRLIVSDAPEADTPVRSRKIGLLAVAALSLAVLAWVSLGAARAERIALPPLVDSTGAAEYAALARASDALLVAEVVERGFEVTRGNSGDNEKLTARLVMWDAKPFLALEASRGGGITWSAMIDASGGKLPPALEHELDYWRASRRR